MYRSLMSVSRPALLHLLDRRSQKGKEDPSRLSERKGTAGRKRPAGKLAWVHAASVGEAQSALILIEALLKKNEALNILVTTGTVTSAKMMAKNLPERAFHQFYPLDHPDWVDSFLSHWHPDAVFWMESELWPNMLLAIKERNIPAALINARLSERSYKTWRIFGRAAKNILETFSIILTQNEKEAQRFRSLKAPHVLTTDNLKYNARALGFDEKSLTDLSSMTARRPLWLYASTHDGEEALACGIHQILKATMPDLLTVIVPRHPDRRENIVKTCESYNLNTRLRGANHDLPQREDDIYIADTLGELGLFYRLSPVACIGRCFSNDGGGGHNPVEAMQLNCAVLFGPNVQNLQEIYDEIDAVHAAIKVNTEEQFTETLRDLLNNPKALQDVQTNAVNFAHEKAKVLVRVLDALEPILVQSGIVKEGDRECA